MKARLSDQALKIQDGSSPMPMYTCLHVKSNVSAKIFQEWYEFTPFEVSVPKYGINFKTSDFACKFYMGQKIKSFPEVRLHFLYGIWGSAFTIQFKRLWTEKGRNGHNEILKMILPNPSSTDINTCLESNEPENNTENFLERCLEVDEIETMGCDANSSSDNDEDDIKNCDEDKNRENDHANDQELIIPKTPEDNLLKKRFTFRKKRQSSLPKMSCKKSNDMVKTMKTSKTSYDLNVESGNQSNDK